MTMTWKMPLAGAVALGMLGAAVPADAGTVRVGHSTWVGNGPLYIARDKGYFKEEGIEFEDINIGDLKLRFAAAAAGEIDIILTTIDAMVLYLKEGDEYLIITGADTSAGGDGIVSTKEIGSITDLKGKKVAFNEGSTSQFLLDVLLTENGMSEADIVPVNMDPGDAGAALIAGQVDAAVTWEPWLTKAKNSENGKILFDTTNRQDFITDFVIVRKEFLAEHPDDVAGFVKAWYKAVDFYKANEKEAIDIMAQGSGDWLADPAVFAETMAGVKFYDRARSMEIFGTKEKPGPIVALTQSALDVWKSLGRLQTDVDATKIINWDFVAVQ
ncbi:MAG TPA: ABC transporter substrate-binding protein [Bauldia sp.]|nr:ABC transporter substrate-binding protein [Bauldia sp.]